MGDRLPAKAKDVMTRRVTFEEVMARWNWQPIPRCPGRYKQPATSASVCEMAGATLPVERYEGVAHDTVLVMRLDGGGLISYEKQDGTFVHTLGDNNGFTHKLDQLGIGSVSDRNGS